jgi:hypothetical protein
MNLTLSIIDWFFYKDYGWYMSCNGLLNFCEMNGSLGIGKFTNWMSITCPSYKSISSSPTSWVFLVLWVSIRSLLQKLAINVNVNKVFSPFQHELILHFVMDKWVWIPILFTWWHKTHLHKDVMHNHKNKSYPSSISKFTRFFVKWDKID